MIQPLRNYHRWIFEGLGVVLPIIFLAGLAVRPSATQSASAATPIAGKKIVESTGAWKNHIITTTLYSDDSGVSFRLQPVSSLNQPDLLLYWSADTVPPTSGFGENATLLGAFEVNRLYKLPAGSKGGSLLLYSLAHRQLVDSAQLDPHP